MVGRKCWVERILLVWCCTPSYLLRLSSATPSCFCLALFDVYHQVPSNLNQHLRLAKIVDFIDAFYIGLDISLQWPKHSPQLALSSA